MDGSALFGPCFAPCVLFAGVAIAVGISIAALIEARRVRRQVENLAKYLGHRQADASADQSPSHLGRVASAPPAGPPRPGPRPVAPGIWISEGPPVVKPHPPIAAPQPGEPSREPAAPQAKEREEVAPAPAPLAEEVAAAPTAPPRKVAHAPPASAAAPAARAPIQWEQLIGLKVLGWIGIVAVLMAVAYFVYYAYDQGWFGRRPWMRVAIPSLLGAGLLVAGEIFSRKAYVALARVSTGGGLAALYFAVFSGWALGNAPVIPNTATWPLMAVITGLAIVLSVRYSSLTVAIISLAGGLAAPVLIRGHEDPGHVLFLYVLAVNAGVLGVAYFNKWRILNVLALLCTIADMLFWLIVFYWREGSPPEKIAMAVGYLTAAWAVYFLLMVIYHLLGRHRSSRLDLPVSIVNVAWYFGILYELLRHDHHAWLGPVAAALGLVYLGQAVAMRRWAAGQGRLILLQAGQALCLLTLAVPIHLDGIYIPMAWAVWATLLYWLGLRWKDWRLRAVGLAVHVASLGALGWYADEAWRAGGMLILNGRTATFLLVAGGLAVSAWLYSRSPARNRTENILLSIASALAHVLMMTLLAVEVEKWHTRAMAAVADDDPQAARGLRTIRDAILVTGYALYGLAAVGLVAVLRSVFHQALALVSFAAAMALLAYGVAADRLPPLESLPGANHVGATYGCLAACLALAAILSRYAMPRVAGRRGFAIAYELLAVGVALGLYLTEVSRLTRKMKLAGDPLWPATILAVIGAALAVYFIGLLWRSAGLRSTAHRVCGILCLLVGGVLLLMACVPQFHAYAAAVLNARGIALAILAAAVAGAAVVARYHRGAEKWRPDMIPYELIAWLAILVIWLTEIWQWHENRSHRPDPMPMASALSLAACGFAVYVCGLIWRGAWIRSTAHRACAIVSLCGAIGLMIVASLAVSNVYDVPILHPRGVGFLILAGSLAAAAAMPRFLRGDTDWRRFSIPFELLAWGAILALYLTEVRQWSELREAADDPVSLTTVLSLSAIGFAIYLGGLMARGLWLGSTAHYACGAWSMGIAAALILVASTIARHTYGVAVLSPRGIAMIVLAGSLIAAVAVARRGAGCRLVGSAAAIAYELGAWAVVLALYATEIWQLSDKAAIAGHRWPDGTLGYLLAAAIAAYVGALYWRGFRVPSVAYRMAGLACMAGAISVLCGTMFSGAATYATVLLQPRGAAYALLIGSLAWAIVACGRRLPADNAERRQSVPLLTIVCHAAALVLFTLEADDFWTTHGNAWFGGSIHGWYARHATLSVGYAVYAVAMLAGGIMRRRPLLRGMALALLAGTIIKVFLFDMREIETIWRVLSFFGLGVLLLAGSMLYHKYRRVIFPSDEGNPTNG